MPLVKISDIDEITKEILGACKVSDSSIDVIIDTINYANRCDIPTHGVGRVPLYVKKIQSGFFNPEDEMETIVDAGAISIIDAKHGFGQVAAKHAVDIAVEKAKKYGISAVGVRNSNNFGTAGYFGYIAAKEGMASLIFANASPAIAPTGGTKTILGTNPLCFAFPGSESNDPIVLDMATTVVARGKVRLAAKNGDKIPLDWAMDAEGKPTDDPNEALKGSLLPIGGYKGYGLSLFVDIFAGLLAGSNYAGDTTVQQLSKMDTYSNNGHFFILIDTNAFMSSEELYNKVDNLYKSVKGCGLEGAVMLPGEPGFVKMHEQTECVTIPQKQIDDVNETAAQLGLSFRLKAEE